MLLCPLLVVPLLASMSAFVDAPERRSSRGVRASTPVAQAIIDDAIDRSPTIRSLVDDLSQSDLIVYVDVRHDRPSLEGRTRLVEATASARYVRVDIYAKLAPARRAEVLAHELWHALEIANASDVRDDAGMRELFGRIGWRAGDRYETDAAVAVERWVRGDWALGGFESLA